MKRGGDGSSDAMIKAYSRKLCSDGCHNGWFIRRRTETKIKTTDRLDQTHPESGVLAADGARIPCPMETRLWRASPGPCKVSPY